MTDATILPTPNQPTTSSASRWAKALTLLIGLIVLLVFAQWQLAQDMFAIWWRSKTFNHCLVIPLISAYLVYERRQYVTTLTPQASALGLLLLLAASLLLLLAELAGVAVAAHFAFILSVQALVWTVLGTEICRRLLFPLLYLWFMVPFGEFLVPQLQDVTADMAVWLLRLFDIPVFRDGHFIALPNGDFLVEEACSGINYLIASLALGTVYAYLQYRSYRRRALFIALSTVVPIIANGVRAFGIILTAHLTNNEYAVGVDHLIYGWIFFGVVIFLLFALGRSFSDGGPDAPGAGSSTTERRSRQPYAVLIGALLLVSLPAALQRTDAANTAPMLAITSLPASWQVQSSEPLGAQLLGAAEVQVLRDDELEVIIGYFPNDSRGHELVNDKHRVYDKQRWRRLQADRRIVSGVEADGLRLGNPAGEALLVHTLYVFADSVQGRDWRAKWQQMQARLARRPAPALHLIVARASSMTDAELEQRLAGLLPVLQQRLRELAEAGSVTP
ncbi:exosortase A [Permianibacter sp. IMCC34836]|uniref:exosortase A n=1 Tax=Permianibacter fluminis TaxID=2738515 RepID=UPI0015532B03|nr:exosortase A [Permianibacter fluminis]NQD35587.1 exosortase A [Permianibacter fluminis]